MFDDLVPQASQAQPPRHGGGMFDDLIPSASPPGGGQPNRTRPPMGPIEDGNIDLAYRPEVKNPDGSISTVRSKSFNIDGRETLVPTVSDDGRVMDDKEAVETFRRSGKHLGQFGTPRAATAAGERIHEDQSALHTPQPADDLDSTLNSFIRAGRELFGSPSSGGKGLPFTFDENRKFRDNTKEPPTPDPVKQWEPTQPFGGDFVRENTPQSLTSGNAPALNQDREAGFLDRAGASIKMTPEGKRSFYEARGYKVATDRDGKLFLQDQKTKEWFPEDSGGLNLSDAADWTGDAIQLGSEVIGGRAARPIGATKGAGVGNLVRQAASEALPGNDQMSLTDRGVSVGTDAALAGTGQFVTNKAFQGFDRIRPHNALARSVERKLNTPFSRESEQIEQATGQNYTIGQKTGSRSLLTIEGMVRRHPASADKMAALDAKQLDVSLRNLDSVMDGITKADASAEAVGNKVSTAFDRVLNGVTKIRRDTAKIDFGEVDKLAGRYRVIKPDALLDEVDALRKRLDVPGAGDESARIVRAADALKADIRERAGPDGLTAQETQRLLEIYGNASKGSGAVFKDMEDAQQRMITGNLHKALMRDLDAAADGGGHVGNVATALKTARDNYKANSKAIDNLEESVLGRMFGGVYDKAPERITQALSNMKGSELRESFAILNKADPAVAQVVKRNFIERSLIDAGLPASKSAPNAQVSGEQMFSAAKFLTSIRKSPVWDALAGPERDKLTMAVRDMERLANRAGTDGSPTAPLQWAMQLVSESGAGATAGLVASGGDPTAMAAGALAGAGLRPAARIAINATITRRIGRLLTDPAGQRALRTMRSTNPGTKAYTAAAAYAGTLMARPDQGDALPDASLNAALEQTE